jgi:crotonobetainyl-CoA:carnitine CoA-transferase CaiB-like acyl-CoA transferase
MPIRPLTGIRVVDLAVDRGELCGRLLSDLGADVIKVEPPEGSPSRSLPPLDPLTPEHSLFFTMRNCGKRSVVIDPADAASMANFESLLASADVLVGSAEPGAAAAAGAPELEAEAIAARHPHLVMASITAYGRSGPYAGRDVPGSVIDATSGMCWKAGLSEREPLMPPGNISGDIAGLMAAFAIVCALIQRCSHGAGQLIDVSANEAAAQITDWSMSNSSKNMVAGIEPVEVRAGPGPVYTILAAADGFVRLVVLSPRQWHAMRAWLGEPDYLQDPEYDGFIARFMVADAVLNPLYEELFSTMTMEEVAIEAQRRGIVATPILKPGDVITNEHFEARKTFDRVPLSTRGTMSLPSGWMEMDGERIGPTGRPPHLGEHTDEVLASLQDAPRADWPLVPDAAPEPALPLVGLRVADFGHGGVGVEISRMLAEYGADVIKVESRTYPDFIRVILGGEMSPSFASSSRSKRGLGIDAKTAEGRRLLLELASGATGAPRFDVVVENGSTGVMDGLGLGYRDFAAANPDVVMVSSQLMGSSGPWSAWRGYGPNTQVTGGMTHLWDYPDVERPSGSQSIFPDHWAGRMGALAAVAAVLGRRRGVMEAGCHAEVCQVEQVVGVMGDLLARESLQAGSVQPQGNRRDRGAPWGFFACEGDDQWVAICCRDDAEWAALADLTGIDDPSLAALDVRREREDEVEQAVTAWTRTLSKHAVTEACLAAGVPAGPMLTSGEQLQDPHLAARGYLVELDQPPIGVMTFEGPAFTATGMADADIRPAPGLGEHTREIIAELGLDEAAVDDLIARGILETEPPR